MNTLKFLPQAERYLKKIKDKRLSEIFRECIEKIRLNPFEAGDANVGDLKGFYTHKFRYQKTDYRIGYSVKENEDGTLTIIIMIGKRENFYNDFKNYLREVI